MIAVNSIHKSMSDDQVGLLWETHPEMESFLTSLRDAGASKVESIRAVRRVAKTSIENAKKIVHLSRAWMDQRCEDDSLHEMAQRALLPDHDVTVAR